MVLDWSQSGTKQKTGRVLRGDALKSLFNHSIVLSGLILSTFEPLKIVVAAVIVAAYIYFSYAEYSEIFFP